MRHADCLFYPCYVHCRRPRVLCDKCGAVQVNAPFERKNSRFTLLFEGYAMLLLQDVPRARAARLLRCDEKSLAGILMYWVHDAVNRMGIFPMFLPAPLTRRPFGAGTDTSLLPSTQTSTVPLMSNQSVTKRLSKMWAKNRRRSVAVRGTSTLSLVICRQATYPPSGRYSRMPGRPSTNFTSSRYCSKPWIRYVRTSRTNPPGKRNCLHTADCSWCRKGT